MDSSSTLCKKVAAGAFLLLACLVPLAAQTTYIGAAGGLWTTAANWSNGLPAAGNPATIPGGGSVVVSAPLTTNFQVDNFGTLNVNAAWTLAAAQLNNSGTVNFNAAGSLTNSATFNNFSVASFAGPAVLNNNTGAVLANGGTLTLNTTLTNNGDVVNNGIFTATAGIVQNLKTFTNNQTINVLQFTQPAAGSGLNNFGATWNSLGTGAVLSLTGGFTNNGFVNVKPSATATLSGFFGNNGQLSIESPCTLAAAGNLQNNGTVINKSTFTELGAVINSNNFFNEGTCQVNGNFAQNQILENRVGATLNVNLGSTFALNFGTQTTNWGTMTNNTSITSVGLITNNGTFQNVGTLTVNSGGTLRNNLTFNNIGTVNSQNQVFCDQGVWTNTGTLNVQSGSIFEVKASFLNGTSGKVNNLYEIRVKPAGIFTNNGMLPTNIRMYVEGNLTNNAYVLNTGDVFVLAGGTLNNKEIFDNVAGNVSNAGTLVNSKSMFFDECSVLSNTGNINNTGGLLQTKSFVFQRGTLTGNAISSLGGYIHTGATSAAPTVCKNVSITADDNGVVKCYATGLLAFSSFDSCQNILYTANGIPRPTFGCAQVGTIQPLNVCIRTRLGDSLTCVSNITVTDILAPKFSNCPPDQTVFTVGTAATATWTAPTVVDNCTAAPTVTSTFAPGASFPIGITGVAYTATDAKANSAICQFRVSVIASPGTPNCTGDVTGPVLTNCPANQSVTTDFKSQKIVWTAPTPTDNCFPVSLFSNFPPGTDFQLGSTSVVYTARDGSGNTSTCGFTVTLTQNNLCATDTQKPTIFSCPANIYSATNATLNGAVAIWPAPSAGDNCALTSFASNFTSGTVFPVGTTTVLYTAVDGSSNSATCQFTVIVGSDPCPGDVTGPTFTGCPANISASTSNSSATATWTAPTASDPCGGVSVSSNFAPGASFGLGVTSVVYSASDKKGSRSTCSFLVTVTNVCLSDLTPPTIQNCPANMTVTTAGTSANATWTAPTAADNCGVISLTASRLPGSSFPLGTTTVIYTASDVRLNTSTCGFTVNVIQGSTPTCATNTSPANNATGLALASVTLTWGAVATATSYDVYLGTANPPTTLLASNVAGTSQTATNLAAGTTYFWYVVPKNANGAATGCSAGATRFSTGSAPTCATNSSPANNATGVSTASVALTWGAVSGATSYDVYLGTANPPPTLLASNVAGTSATATNLTAGASYFWYVVPKNAFGSSAGCGASATRFTTVGAASCSNLQVLFLAEHTTLNATDQLIKDRMETLGLTVTVLDDNSLTVAQTTGKALIFISSTVSGGTVAAYTWLSTLAIPIINCEKDVMDNLKMTGATSGTDFGTDDGEDALNFIAPAHPIAGGLSGVQVVYSNAIKMVWGKPSSGATVIAQMTSNSTRAGIFSYETGATMVGQTAPARRVGFFFYPSSSSFSPTAAGWAVFENALRWAINCPSTPPCTKTALLVVGNTTLGAGDAALKTRLQNLGLTVTPVSDLAVQATDATGKGLVVVSSTSTSANILNRLTNVAVPLISYESRLYDNLGMTSTVDGTDYATYGLDYGSPTVAQLNFVNSSHPIAGGLSGLQAMYTSANYMQWGKPGAGATNVATIPGQSTKSGIFCYETGAAMVGMNAPARRVGFFLYDLTPTLLNTAGWRVFDNAVKWAMNCSQLNNLGLAAQTPGLAFSAYRDGFDTKLKWTSNTGETNDYFIVERSANGRNFSPISKVDGRGAADEFLYFNELDQNPLPGVNFYRLRLVGRDGAERFSETREVAFPVAEKFAVFPNPASESAWLNVADFSGKTIRVELVNAFGQSVRSLEFLAGDEPVSLDLAGLPDGVYSVAVRCSGVVRVLKLAVNR